MIDSDTILYHVTPTKNLRAIKKLGLARFKTSQWVQAGTGERYGEGEIYAFSARLDAIRWAGRMDWEFHKATGTGKISIVSFRAGSLPWEVDTSDPLSQCGRQGDWLMSQHAVHPTRIIEVVKVDTDMLREAVL